MKTGKSILTSTLLPVLFLFQFGVLFFVPEPAGARDACSGLPLFGSAGAPVTQANCTEKCKEQVSPSGQNYVGGFWSDNGFTLSTSYAGVESKCCCKAAPAAPAGPPPAACLPGSTSLCNPLGSEFNDPSNIPNLIGNVIKGLFGVIGTIALVIFIFGGFLWMTAFGEESKVKKGWDTMIWAAMGLAVIFGSYVAVDFILKAILGS